MERFAADSMASIPKASVGWNETVAAYRVFNNNSIDWRALMPPHWQQTQRRTASYPVILCLEDATGLNFNGQETKGLGPLSYEARRGMYVHPTYAVDQDAPDNPRLNDVLRLVARLGGFPGRKAMANREPRRYGWA